MNEEDWEYIQYIWTDIEHWKSRKNPKIVPCWFHPNPMNIILTERAKDEAS